MRSYLNFLLLLLVLPVLSSCQAWRDWRQAEAINKHLRDTDAWFARAAARASVLLACFFLIGCGSVPVDGKAPVRRSAWPNISVSLGWQEFSVTVVGWRAADPVPASPSVPPAPVLILPEK